MEILQTPPKRAIIDDESVQSKQLLERYAAQAFPWVLFPKKFSTRNLYLLYPKKVGREWKRASAASTDYLGLLGWICSLGM
jgi:hypothetical protein